MPQEQEESIPEQTEQEMEVREEPAPAQEDSDVVSQAPDQQEAEPEMSDDEHHHEEPEGAYTMEDFVAWHNEQHAAEGYDMQSFMEWHSSLHANATLEAFIAWHDLNHEDHKPCNECAIIECPHANQTVNTTATDILEEKLDENQLLITEMLEQLMDMANDN